MVAVAVVATVTVGLVTGHVARQRLYAEVDRSLEQATVVVVRDRPGALPRPAGRLPRVEAIVLPERTGLESVVVQVVRPDGRVVRSNSDVLLPVDDVDQLLILNAQGQRLRTVAVDGERYRVRTLALPGGAVQAGRSLTETERVLRELRIRTVWWTALIATMAAAGGWLLARGITARLGRLSHAAEQLAMTGGSTASLDLADLSAGPPRGRDEVGMLSHSFAVMVNALTKARAEQERLVQDAGHELRTPLTSLRTNVDVLTRYTNLDDDTRGVLLGEIRRDVEELASLVNEVLDVAAGTRNHEQPGPLVLGRVVGDVVERFRRRSGREVEVHADDTVVMAGRGGVERAVSNLLDNAHKFDPGESPLEVRVVDGRLEVLDHGPGVPLEERELVFERFARSVTARSMPGSGLGLAIVREVVIRAGGTVFIADRPGGGAVIGFQLPVAGRATIPSILTESSPVSEPAPTSAEEADVIGGEAPDHENRT